MEFSIKELIGGGASDIVKSIGEAIDRNITNTGEKMKLFNELQQIMNENEKEVSSRHVADMSSDSWLSKNVRPLALIFLLFLFTLFCLLDGLEIFSLNYNYIELLGQLTNMVLAFYFGSRGIEKITSIVSRNRK